MISNSHEHEPSERAGHSTVGRLVIAATITLAVFVIELVGAMLTNSLALLADAAHMVTDVAALGVAILATWLAGKPHSAARSYGSMRAEILAALANGIGLIVIAVYIFVEAIGRLRMPPLVNSGPMMVVGAATLVANLVTARVLMSGPGWNLNVRAALLHVFSDAVNTIGVLVAGAMIFVFGWYLADPIVSMAVGVMLVMMSVRLIRQATHILLEGTPRNVDLADLERSILAQEGVMQVHDLHAWTLSSGYNAVTAHVVVSDRVKPTEHEQVLDGLRHMIPDRFPVRHITIQLEESSACCEETHMPGIVVHGHPGRTTHIPGGSGHTD